MTNDSDVLVLDGSAHNALAAVRALGKAGLKIAVGVPHRRFVPGPLKGAAAASRFSHAWSEYQRPSVSIKCFLTDIKSTLTRLRPQVVIPMGMETVVACATGHAELSEIVKLPFPALPHLLRAHDKADLLRLASEAGIPIPQMDVLESEQDLESSLKRFQTPVVLKARRNTGGRGWRLVNAKNEVSDAYHELTAEEGDGLITDYTNPMLQEYIPGQIWDACILAQDGELKRVVTQKRILTVPLRGGGGILNETVLRNELITYAEKLVDALKWNGVGQVEFKEDSQGKLRLMEFNPKFWGTLALSIEAGVNFPLLAYQHALGFKFHRDLSFREGVRYRWLLPAGIPAFLESDQKWAFLKDMYKRSTHSDFRLDDPAPFVQHLLVGIKQILRPKS